MQQCNLTLLNCVCRHSKGGVETQVTWNSGTMQMYQMAQQAQKTVRRCLKEIKTRTTIQPDNPTSVCLSARI